MKPLIFIILFAPLSARAAVTFTNTFNVSTTIPDNNDSGYSSYQTITPGENGTPEAPEISYITSVTVDLNFSGGWNGDLYVYLVHESGFSVLLNRIGRDTGNSAGSNGTGMTITLADDAPTDVHLSNSGNSVLTGIYKPDGRETDPDNVVNADLRSALLSSFNGLNAAGEWTLFVADLGAGDQSVLESWSLSITAIPEPSSLLLLSASLPLLFRRRR